MKKLLLLLTVCLIAFCGCKKDEDDEKSLVGTWATEEGEERLYDKYNADGTGEDWSIYKGVKEEGDSYKYSYDSKKNTITYTYSDETVVMNVVEFSENKLVLKYEDNETTIYYRQ